jgi:hypothetical protein
MAIVKKIDRRLRDLPSLPQYLGTVTPAKTVTNGKGRNVNTHYVLINPEVAKRLGFKARSTMKSNDQFAGGAIFDTNRKFKDASGKTNKTIAKRYITPGHKAIEIFTGNYILNEKTKKPEQESYTVGFPTTLSIVEIISLSASKMPLAKFIRHGGKTYTVRKITLPKGVTIENKGKEAK